MTARIYLVRHGRAAASWTEDRDPGLDDEGRRAAEALAERLADRGPFPIWTSPLRRTIETARPLAARWETDPRIVPDVAEVPSPVEDLERRGAWLRAFMASAWPDAPDALKAWRSTIVETLCGLSGDTVIVTHFMVINAAVGAALGVDDVVTFRPGYCSLTLLETDGGRLELIERGHEAETLVR